MGKGIGMLHPSQIPAYDYENDQIKVSANHSVYEADLHTEQIGANNGETLLLNGSATVLLDVVSIGSGDLTPEVSVNGTRWTQIKAHSMDTGNPFERIGTVGCFVCSTAGWKYFRAPYWVVGTGAVTAKAYGLQEKITVNSHEFAERVSRRPLPLRPTHTKIINDSLARVLSMEKESGSLYAYVGSNIKKSIDWGTNWTTLFTHPEGIIAAQVQKLDNGAVLAGFANGEIFLSDTSEANFAKVLQFTTAGTRPAAQFGTKAFQNFVVMGEYGPKTPPDNARIVYLSKDYGATWSPVFEGLQANEYHLHDVAYDPYNDVLWACVGDGVNKNVHYSVDWGANWETVIGGNVCQFTQIIPLPNCVLFVTDDRYVSVWRWDRPKRGIQASTHVKIEPAYIIRRNTTNTGNPIATAAAVVYGDDAAAYFGFAEPITDVSMRGTVWATTDGYNFYRIWVDPDYPTRTVSPAGIEAISGPSKDGFLAVNYVHKPEGQVPGSQLIKLATPTWK